MFGLIIRSRNSHLPEFERQDAKFHDTPSLPSLSSFFGQPIIRITLGTDDTFDAAHGGKQLRLFNVHCDDCGFQPTMVFEIGGGSAVLPDR